MNWKPVIFFITVIATLLYFIFFLENKNSHSLIKMGGKKIKIRTATLLAGIFIDGMILGALFYWLILD